VGHQNGAVCQSCRGVGVGLSLNDRILYWGKIYDPANIIYDKTIRRVKIAVNIALALIGVSGLILMGYLGYKDNFESYLSLKYWFTPSPEKLYFWLTLFVDLYLYYRLEQESSGKFDVLTKVYEEYSTPVDFLDWPTIWKLKKEKMLDVSVSFTEQSATAVMASWELAKIFGHAEVNRLHICGVLPQFNKSAVILGRLGVAFDQLKGKISRMLTKDHINRGGIPILSAEIQKTLLLSYMEAFDHGKKRVDLPEIMYALASPEKIGLQSTDLLEELLIDLSLNYQKMKNAVDWIRIQEELREGILRFRALSRYKPKNTLDRAMTATATPLLNEFSEDLTSRASYGALFPCIDREKEFENIFRIFEGSREGVLLIGPRGVGKTAIIEGLAQKMVTEDVPELLQDKRLVSLDLAKLLAGVNPAEAEQRMLAIASELIHSGNIVLVIENLSAVSGISSGSEGSLDLAEVLAQLLSRHQFHCLATATQDEYVKFIENGNLGSEFQVVKVDEMEINGAICVLEAKSGPIEYTNEIFFSYDAIEKAAMLSSRYIHDRYLPDKGIEILEQTAIKVRNERGKKQIATGDDVAAVISAMTNIPLTKVSENESHKLLNLEEKIHERMVGQEEAVKIVATSLRRARAELREGKRPIASLLFLGPTGVGKTELAKTVSEVYFNKEENMLRFDMSEYQDQASIARLIGVGKTPGQLTEKVRKQPFSLVLFDEVEKAHPDILNLFLQLMDDGRLTDAQGKTIDFTSTIIIMTSNAGAQSIQDQINGGKSIEQIKNNLINEELKVHFRPEFINRFDGVVVFTPLSMMDVLKIARLMVNKIIKRLDEKGIEFTVDDEAISELAELGYDPKFGARPLRRVIQERIDDVLAEHLLAGEIARRDKVILQVGGNLKIEKAEQL